MADYILREDAIEAHCMSCQNIDQEDDKNACWCMEKDRINRIPAADVVSRDCYDRILAENDAMREMLAQIGKKPGDKMDDVRRVVTCKECKFRNTVACLATVPKTMKDNEFCCEGKRRADNG